MRYLHFALGHQPGGTSVCVRLVGNAANIRLLDGANFERYRAGQRFSYLGGLARRSPAFLTVPSAGTWYVVVDMMGLRGEVRASVDVA